MKIIAAFLGLIFPLCAYAQGPMVDSPIVAGFVGKPVEIRGIGFGMPKDGHNIHVRSGTFQIKLSSFSPYIQIWEDTRIVLNLPDRARSGWIRISTLDGVSDPVGVNVYKYDWFDIPATSGTNASPLAVALDTLGRLWVNQEFHLEFQMLDPWVGEVIGLPIPKPPNPGPFATTLFNDHRTQTSTLGEDIIVDPQGQVWFSQGGGYLYQGIHPNHSRIVSFDPEGVPGQKYRVYNIPGNWNEVMGLAWDSVRGRLWFTEGGLVTGNKLVSFNPERVPYDNNFDFSQPLDHLICAAGAPGDDCFHVYTLPSGQLQPAHVIVDGSGFVWYTGYWSNSLGRLDPNSGEVDIYPLPDAIGQSDPVIFVGSGPWQILLSPDNGDIVFNEFFDSTIDRFRITRIGDPACLSLNAEGRNPCIDELVVPNADLVNEQVHSIAYDSDGNLWFTQHGPDEAGTNVSVGFVTADWENVVRLPPLSLFQGEGGAASAGIAINHSSGEIWFAEFFRQRIGRLRKVNPVGSKN